MTALAVIPVSVVVIARRRRLPLGEYRPEIVVAIFIAFGGRHSTWLAHVGARAGHWAGRRGGLCGLRESAASRQDRHARKKRNQKDSWRVHRMEMCHVITSKSEHQHHNAVCYASTATRSRGSLAS